MHNTWKILITWLSVGLASGVVLAVLAVGPGGASVIFIPLGALLGVIFSSLHCLVLFVLEKSKKKNRLFPAGFLLAFCATYFSILKYNEYTCVISGSDSFIKATEYIDKIGFDLQYLDTTGYKLKGSCEYGFEYKSKESYRLIIIDSTGRARLNN